MTSPVLEPGGAGVIVAAVIDGEQKEKNIASNCVALTQALTMTEGAASSEEGVGAWAGSVRRVNVLSPSS